MAPAGCSFNTLADPSRHKLLDLLGALDDRRGPMASSAFVYVTYTRTQPEKLWSALTGAEFIRQYWFGMHCESQWTAGSSWKLVSGDGQIFDAARSSRPGRRRAW